MLSPVYRLAYYPFTNFLYFTLMEDSSGVTGAQISQLMLEPFVSFIDNYINQYGEYPVFEQISELNGDNHFAFMITPVGEPETQVQAARTFFLNEVELLSYRPIDYANSNFGLLCGWSLSDSFQHIVTVTRLGQNAISAVKLDPNDSSALIVFGTPLFLHLLLTPDETRVAAGSVTVSFKTNFSGTFALGDQNGMNGGEIVRGQNTFTFVDTTSPAIFAFIPTDWSSNAVTIRNFSAIFTPSLNNTLPAPVQFLKPAASFIDVIQPTTYISWE